MNPEIQEWKRALDEVFIIRLPYEPVVIVVAKYNGTPGLTVLRTDPNSSLGELRVTNNASWEAAEPTAYYVLNTTAQAGKEIILHLGPAGTQASGGTPSLQMEDSGGAVINPATEDKQDDLMALVGEVDAAPTENTVLERLKNAEDSLAAIQAAHTNKGDLVYNQVTVGAAEVQLSAASVPVADGYAVAIKALAANTGQVYVGKTGVATSTGFELSAKEAISLYVDNLNLIYVIANAADQKVCYIVEKVAA